MHADVVSSREPSVIGSSTRSLQGLHNRGALRSARLSSSARVSELHRRGVQLGSDIVHMRERDTALFFSFVNPDNRFRSDCGRIANSADNLHPWMPETSSATKWSDIDFSRRQIVIRRSISRRE